MCAAPPPPAEAFHGFPGQSTKLQPPCSRYRLSGSAGHSPPCLTLLPAQPHQTPERAAPALSSPVLCLLQKELAWPLHSPRERDLGKKFLKGCKSVLLTSILPLGWTGPSAQPAFSTRHGDVLEGILGHCLSRALENMFHPTQNALFHSSQLSLICICLHYLLGLFAGSPTDGSNSCWVLFMVLLQKNKNC